MCYCFTKNKVIFVAITAPNIRTKEVGESLICEREPLNSSGRYVGAVLKDDDVVFHLPRQLPWILSLRNGAIDCIITGEIRYSADLPQGGLENACKLIFNGKHK